MLTDVLALVLTGQVWTGTTQWLLGSLEKACRLPNISTMHCHSKLTWLIFSDPRPNTLYDSSCLMAKDRWETFFMHVLQKVIQVCMAHGSCHNLHDSQANKMRLCRVNMHLFLNT